MMSQILLWAAFTLFVLAMLALDLGVFHRKAHVVCVKEALIWNVVWTVLALLFNVGVFLWLGKEKALIFFTGYLIERSLSVDNVFVFYLVFCYFAVPLQYQHKILFWGIIGALVMRAILILLGVTLIREFHWIIFVFGPLLIWTGIKMAMSKETEICPERNPLLRLFRRLVPTVENYVDGKFFVSVAGRILATPLLAVLIVIESTDLVFAVDSIPAVLAITTDPFIIYTSNVFAILGMRALYFLLAGAVPMFKYLHYGLSIILVFVGIKMLLSDIYKIPTSVSLIAVGVILALSIVASVLIARVPKETHVLD